MVIFLWDNYWDERTSRSWNMVPLQLVLGEL